MTKLNRLLRQRAVRLLCLVGALLALSPDAAAWYLRGNFPKTGESSISDNWSEGVEMKNGSTVNEYMFGVLDSDGEAVIKLSGDKSDWDNSNIGGNGDQTISETGGNVSLIDDDFSGNITIKLSAGYKYTLKWSSGSGAGTLTVSRTFSPDVNAYYIYYGEANQSWKRVKMKNLGDNLWGGSFKPGAKDLFKIAKYDASGNETLYGYASALSNGVPFTVSTSVDYAISLVSNNAHEVTSVLFNSSTCRTTCTWKDISRDPYSNVETEYPVIYLLGEGLNGQRPSPEWRMKKVSDGKYELEFTARDTKMAV